MCSKALGLARRVQDNVATGVSPTAMGSNYPQYGHTHGDPSVQNIYHHSEREPPRSVHTVPSPCHDHEHW